MVNHVKIHSILTYQTESKRLGCINRDENSVNNMIKLVNYYFKYKDRPEIFKRYQPLKFLLVGKVKCQMMSSPLKELNPRVQLLPFYCQSKVKLLSQNSVKLV